MALSKAAQEIEAEFAAYEERRQVRQTEAWMPEPGTKFKGEVIGLRMGGKTEDMGGYGFYPVIVYKDLHDNSTKAVHAFHTVLRDYYKEISNGEPSNLMGKQHFVSYQGSRESGSRKDKDGNPQVYHLYDVEEVGKETQPIDTGFAF